MQPYFRADLSDRAFPTVERCDKNHEDATTFTKARRQVMEYINSQLHHWQEYKKTFPKTADEVEG